MYSRSCNRLTLQSLFRTMLVVYTWCTAAEIGFSDFRVFNFPVDEQNWARQKECLVQPESSNTYDVPVFMLRACASACDEMRLSVEFVTVGFLGICRQYCCD